MRYVDDTKQEITYYLLFYSYFENKFLLIQPLMKLVFKNVSLIENKINRRHNNKLFAIQRKLEPGSNFSS